MTENAISAQFEQYKKEVELRLQRRSNFEERVLLDRYVLVREIHSKIRKVSTDLNRNKKGANVKGLFHDDDIVPLTSVFELIDQDRSLITERFRKILRSQAELLIEYAKTQDAHVLEKQVSDYLELDKDFDQAMNEVFGLDKITWGIRD